MDPQCKTFFSEQTGQSLCPGDVAPLLGSLKDAQMIFSGQKEGSPYLRGGHALLAPLEKRVAELEGGGQTSIAASGQAVHHLVFSTLLSPGDHIVASFRLFGGTYALLAEHFAKELGVTITWFDPGSPGDMSGYFQPRTKLVFCESISNPDGVIADLETIAHFARSEGVPFLVDNTLGLGLCQPLSHGAFGVTLSLTKYASGKNTVISGAFVDGGPFSFTKDPKLSAIIGGSAPSPSPYPFTSALMKRSVLFGPTPGISDSQAVFTHLETLFERWQTHLSNARAVASFLSRHPAVEWLAYPGYDHDLQNAKRADKYFGGRAGGIVWFGLHGGEEAVERFISQIRVISHRASVGQEQSIVTVPDQTTHRQMPDAFKQALKITPASLRISVGIEPEDLLLQDLAQALCS